MKTVKPIFATETEANTMKNTETKTGFPTDPGFPNVTRNAITRYNTGATANITKRTFARLTIAALFGNMSFLAKPTRRLRIQLKNYPMSVLTSQKLRWGAPILP